MPKLEKITIERKFTICIRRDGHEEWHGVTHTAEATALQGETYEMAEQTLDDEVRRGLVQAYAPMRRGSQRTEIAQEAVGDEEIEELPAPEPPAPPEDPSWCEIHKTKMKKWFAKDGSGNSWYSHKIGQEWCNGHWCLEHRQPFKKFEKSGGTWWSHSYEDPDTGETLWCREDGEQEPIGDPPEWGEGTQKGRKRY